jgi:general secretion pathway protein G
MHARKLVRKGFTLVEILIVVVILGILAAIVIPQFTNASEAAKASSVLSQLQTLRSQVELYKNQHNDTYPTSDGTLTGTWDWDMMTQYTDIDGGTNATSDPVNGFIYGPYMQQAPKNPFVTSTGNANIAVGAAGGTAGWVLNTTTGVIRAAVPTQTAAEQNMDTTNDVATY